MKFQLRPYKTYFPASTFMFDKDFDQELSGLFNEGKKFYPIPLDINETESEYQLYFDIPGLKKDEIKIEIKDGYLIVRGERKLEKENASTSERWTGEFSREIKIPSEVNLEKVAATFESGVLSLKLAKENRQNGRTIDIK